MAEGRLDRHGERLTPLENFFLVHHYDQPSGIDTEQLSIRSTPGHCRTLDHAQIRMLPTRTVVAVLECAGNGRGTLAQRVPGTQFGLGLFGNAEWTGTSLRNLLTQEEIDHNWTTLVAIARDNGTALPENTHASFAKGLPRDKALHPDTIIAWQLNGAPVAAEHGGPFRLVVPGWYGIWWVKWPERLELTTNPFSGFWQNQRYTYQSSQGTVLSVVDEHRPRAVFTAPRPGQAVHDGAPLAVLAWAGEHDVASVEVSADDGNTWHNATRVGDTGRWGWSRWASYLPARLPPGLRRIAARTTDTAGRQQDWQPEQNRLGYGNNGIHTVEIDIVADSPNTQEEL